MNLLRLCTFLDRNRNSASVDLDDIVEERYAKLLYKQQKLKQQNSKNDDNKNQNNNDSITTISDECNELHLLLYFSANWLPDSCNKNLNKKLSDFYRSEKLRKNFELIFISSDKTRDAYNQFLSENKFIRYALVFQDSDLKVSQKRKLFSLFFEREREFFIL